MKSIKLFTLMMLLTMIAGAAYAGCGDTACASSCSDECTASEVSVSGQFRYRINTEGFDFDSDTPLNWFSEARTRVNVKAKAGENAGVFFQAQDSRIIGENPGTSLGDNIDLRMHQGYLWYAPCEKGWFKLGRFALDMHNQRLIGSVGWDNHGRTFEGFNFGRKLTDSIKLTGFATKAIEFHDGYNFFPPLVNIDGDPIADDMFYGLNFGFVDKGFDIFAYLQRSQYDLDLGIPLDGSRMTVGAYSARTFAESADYRAMFAYQTGTVDDGTTSMDLAAMMVFVELGYSLDNGLRLAAVVDYTSGDDPTTPEYEGFSNLYYTGHSFRGAMDFFIDDEMHGLMDMALRVAYPVNDSWKLKGDFHMFSNVEERASTETAIGNEIDLAANYSDGAFSWTTGYSMFTVDSKFATDMGMAKDDAQNWFYTMTTVNF